MPPTEISLSSHPTRTYSRADKLATCPQQRSRCPLIRLVLTRGQISWQPAHNRDLAVLSSDSYSVHSFSSCAVTLWAPARCLRSRSSLWMSCTATVTSIASLCSRCVRRYNGSWPAKICEVKVILNMGDFMRLITCFIHILSMYYNTWLITSYCTHVWRMFPYHRSISPTHPSWLGSSDVYATPRHRCSFEPAVCRPTNLEGWTPARWPTCLACSKTVVGAVATTEAEAMAIHCWHVQSM